MQVRTHVAGLMTAAAILALGAASPVAAAVKTLKPQQFRSMSTGQQERRTSGSLSAEGVSPARFYAPLRLRPGSRITRVVVYYRHLTGSGTGLSVRRARIDAAEEDLPQFAAITTPTTAGVVTTLENPAPVPHRVEAGWQYDVMVQAETSNSFIHGVKVYYQPPR